MTAPVVQRLVRRAHGGKRAEALLICALIGLAAMQPILAAWRLPLGSDALFHLYRLVELDALVREGIIFSRWAPHLARGFGYPLFNYYAPLSYYVPEALHLLGVPFNLAMSVAFVLFVVAAGLGMYLWARGILGERAAILASAAYVLSPYLVLQPLGRSVLPEVFALALLPWVLFALDRYLASGGNRHALWMALLLAAVIVGHNVTAALFTPFLAAYVAVWALADWRHEREGKGRGGRTTLAVRIGGAYLAMLLAAGLTAFFWLPALAERSLVQIGRLTAWSVFDYRENLQGIGQVLALPPLGDVHRVDRPIPCSLSLVSALLALAGLLGLFRWRPSRRQSAQIGFAALAAATAVFMVLPVSRPLWDALPPLHVLQFPWRFLGIANLFVALVAGAAVRGAEALGRRLAGGVLLVAIAALLLWVFAWQYVRVFAPQVGAVALEDVLRYDRQSGYVGTTTAGEYLPVGVRKYPPPHSDDESYIRARLDAASLPPGARVLRAQYGPLEYGLGLESPQAFVAVFKTFYFPGWRAWVDGVEQSITPTRPYGLISVAVPAGSHEVRVAFGSTPLRSLGDALSSVSIVAMMSAMAWSVWAQRGRQREAGMLPGNDSMPAVAVTSEPGASLSARLTWATIAVVLVGFFIKSVCVDPYWARYRRTQFDIVCGANFGDQLILIGADRPQAVQSGGQGEVVLYWRVPAKTATEYSTSLQLVDAQGFRLAQSDNEHPGGVPTAVWEVTEYARDPHKLAVPAGTPPGRYTLRIATYPRGSPTDTLSVLDAEGSPIGRTVDLATLDVLPPEHAMPEDEVAMASRVGRPLGGGLTLVGLDLPAGPFGAGEVLPLQLCWKASRPLDAGLTVQVQLLDAAGSAVVLGTVPPVPGFDTGKWRPGDTWRGMMGLAIPPRLTGRYTLVIVGPDGASVPLGSVEVAAPERLFAAPRMDHTQEAVFGDLVRLEGYTVEGAVGAGQMLSITLVWRVERQTSEPYKTFVHLLGPDGRLLVGSDAVPGDWQRPSTSWVEGEYIVDPHTLLVPAQLAPGTYQLEVGLYNASTLERLTLRDGSISAVLPEETEISS